MFNNDELMLKCLELTKNDAYTRNPTMWSTAADTLYNFIKTKTQAEEPIGAFGPGTPRVKNEESIKAVKMPTIDA